jgi:hypothetical protein
MEKPPLSSLESYNYLYSTNYACRAGTDTSVTPVG